jgi:hypothetical protein
MDRLKLSFVLFDGQTDLVTKVDLKEAVQEINSRFERVDGEMKLNRWLLGFILAGIIALVSKAFFM